jgi:hypothetical protein
MLEADRKAPRKQRHTAHRMWCRLKAEHPEMDIAESTVRRYVRVAEEGFQLASIHFPMVNSSRCTRVLTNFYSVPAPVGCEVQAKVYAAKVEFWYEGKCLAVHDRCFGRQQKVLELEHYLDVLSKKPGALAGSTALEQWRAQGRLADEFRSSVGGIEEAPGQAGRNAGHDRPVVAAGTDARF